MLTLILAFYWHVWLRCVCFILFNFTYEKLFLFNCDLEFYLLFDYLCFAVIWPYQRVKDQKSFSRRKQPNRLFSPKHHFLVLQNYISIVRGVIERTNLFSFFFFFFLKTNLLFNQHSIWEQANWMKTVYLFKNKRSFLHYAADMNIRWSTAWV